LVSKRHGIVEDLEAHLRDSALIGRWTRGARRSESKAVRNFSYRNQRAHGARFACIGDAACFLDPVFSSGVSLALLGAVELSERLVPALERRTEADPSLLAPQELTMRRAYATFAAMIDRFYNTQFVDHFVFGKTPDTDLTRGVISVLAGDVFREGNRFQSMLLESRRSISGFFG
jgi:flavin-dependent dehydrogenase